MTYTYIILLFKKYSRYLFTYSMVNFYKKKYLKILINNRK